MLPPKYTPPNSNYLPITTKGYKTDTSFNVSKTPLNKDHSKDRPHFFFNLGGCYWEGALWCNAIAVFFSWIVLILIFIHCYLLIFSPKDDEYLIRLEQSLRAMLLKLNVSDSLLQSLPEGMCHNLWLDLEKQSNVWGFSTASSSNWTFSFNFKKKNTCRRKLVKKIIKNWLSLSKVHHRPVEWPQSWCWLFCHCKLQALAEYKCR